MEKINRKVTKANGDLVSFSNEKLIKSLKKAGASNDTIAIILSKVKKEYYSKMDTKDIFKIAFSLLKNMQTPVAGKYKLKKAIQELGPSGYPFERYIGEILKHRGLQVRVGIIVQGECVKHEVDVVAKKGDKHYMVECKFHSNSKTTCHVKTPLYIHSRFLDIERAWRKQFGDESMFQEGWLVTNTRFSEDATQYGTCVGLKMVSWDFPEEGNLRELIETSGLHPITCLTTLTKKQKQKLLKKFIVLCRDICQNEQLLTEVGVPQAATQQVMKEATAICEVTP
ncbi:MAG: ATPase [Bacteroidetes bacterium]|nr:MAG: ATPase [Bacteroidota bacterium]